MTARANKRRKARARRRLKAWRDERARRRERAWDALASRALMAASVAVDALTALAA